MKRALVVLMMLAPQEAPSLFREARSGGTRPSLHCDLKLVDLGF